MRKPAQLAGRNTIGLNLGDKYSHFYTLDARCGRVNAGRVKTDPDAIREHFASVGTARVVVETGTQSPWVSRLLAGKSDQTDPEILARVGRLDRRVWPSAHVGGDLGGEPASLDEESKASLAEELVQAREVDVLHGGEAAVAQKDSERNQSIGTSSRKKASAAPSAARQSAPYSARSKRKYFLRRRGIVKRSWQHETHGKTSVTILSAHRIARRCAQLEHNPRALQEYASKSSPFFGKPLIVERSCSSLTTVDSSATSPIASSTSITAA